MTGVNFQPLFSDSAVSSNASVRRNSEEKNLDFVARFGQRVCLFNNPWIVADLNSGDDIYFRHYAARPTQWDVDPQ